MARLFPKIRDVIGEESLLSSWNECLRCMDEYQHYSVSAKKCYSYLSELENHVWAATHGKLYVCNCIDIGANLLCIDQQNNNASTMMSSIQILNTLPPRQPMNGQIQLLELPVQQQELQQLHSTEYNNNNNTFNYNNNNNGNSNIENWDFDLMQQDMSWLGRLPVYTDLESEYQNSLSGNGWGGLSFL